MASKLKAEGIPLWITLFLMLLVLFGIGMGVPALLGQGVMDTHSIGWGGRQLGIAIGSIIAILYRSPIGYVVIFACHTLKETGDLLETLAANGPELATFLSFAPFIVPELISLWFSFKATKAQ